MTDKTILINEHLKILGMQVKDKVTGFEGVVSSISFDLYGCIQCVVAPHGLDKDGKVRESFWFDINRLAKTSKSPVMEPPKYNWSPEAIAAGEKGPAEKPARRA